MNTKEEWQARVELGCQPRAATSARGAAGSHAVQFCPTCASSCVSRCGSGIISRNVLVNRSLYPEKHRWAGGRYKLEIPCAAAAAHSVCSAWTLSRAPPPASLRFFTLALALQSIRILHSAAAAQPCLQLAHSTARIGLVLQGNFLDQPPHERVP